MSNYYNAQEPVKNYTLNILTVVPSLKTTRMRKNRSCLSDLVKAPTESLYENVSALEENNKIHAE